MKGWRNWMENILLFSHFSEKVGSPKLQFYRLRKISIVVNNNITVANHATSKQTCLIPVDSMLADVIAKHFITLGELSSSVSVKF